MAAFLAVTLLLAHEFSQFTGAFAAMPASPDVTIARADDVTQVKALRVHHQLQVAEVVQNQPFEVADVIHINRHVSRPARETHPAAQRNATAPRVMPHPAEIDAQRFSVKTLAERQVAPAPKSVFFASALLDGVLSPSADADPAIGSGWDQRLGRAVASAEHFTAPIMIALALAVTEEETVVALSDPAQGDEAAATVGGPAPMVLAMAVPMPQPRPAIRAVAEPAQVQASIAEAASVPTPRPARSSAKPESVLAYASPDVVAEEEKSGGIFSRLLGGHANKGLPGRSAKVAVYDISSATVYMPNGEKLEAHSGLAHMQDEPGYVKEKNRGPTPPNLYNLRMRESRFHGVEAIRLLPADGRKKFNRDGLLAHTYMYVGGGSRSQSNGCVVFKDYKQFLAAFKRGEVKRMIVVPTMDKLPTYLAAL